MIKNVMTDEGVTALELRLSNLKKKFNIKSDELCEMHEEIQRIENELKTQKILIATFNDVFPKK